MEIPARPEDREAIYAAALIVASADRHMGPAEAEFLVRTRQRLGLEDAVIRGLHTLCRERRLRVRPPQDPSARRLLLEVVSEAARVDGELQGEESKVLAVMAARLGVSTEAGSAATPPEEPNVLPMPTLKEDLERDLNAWLEALRSPNPMRAVWSLRTTSLGILVVNGCVLLLVLFFGWDVFQVVFCYWAETLVIALYNAIKIILARGDHPRTDIAERIGAAGVSTLALGAFSCGHLIFILGLLDPSGGIRAGKGPSFEMVYRTLSDPGMQAAIGVMLLSHGYRFLRDYVWTRKYVLTRAEELLFAGFARIAVMQFAVIVGAIPALILPRLFSAVLVPLKTWFDLSAHRQEASRL